MGTARLLSLHPSTGQNGALLSLSPHPMCTAEGSAFCLPDGGVTVVSTQGATGSVSRTPFIYLLQTQQKSPSSQVFSLTMVSFDEHKFLNFSIVVKKQNLPS